MSGNIFTSGINNFRDFRDLYDVIEIIFPNTKGYNCGGVSTLCFPAKPSPLIATEADFVKEGGIYYYIITEDDYSNAFDL